MFKKIQFSSVVTTLLLGSAFLLPIFFLPFTSDLFDINKRFLFFALTLIVLLVGAVHVLVKKELRFTRTPWTVPVLLFGISTLITLLVISPNKIQALSESGGLYLAFTLLFLAGTSLVRKNMTDKLLQVLSFAGVIVTFVTLLDRFGVSITKILSSVFGLAIPAGTQFFITGSPLFSVFFLTLVAIMLGIRFFQRRGSQKSLLHIVFALICVVGVIVNALALTPTSATHPQFLSFLDSWSIATDVVKTPLNAVLGVGTDSYASAFSIFKPVRLNQSPLWFVRFNNGRDSILELLVTQGVFGMIAWILILLTTLRLIKTAKGEQLALGVGTLIIEGIFLFFPPNILLVSLLCIFLVAWSASLKERELHTSETVFSLFSFADAKTLALGHASRIQSVLSQLVACVAVLVVIVGFYGVARAYQGEYYFNKSLIFASKGDGKSTYDYAVKAIVANPYMENYHRAFAITNLSLAQVISQNKTLSDQDKQNVLTLIQQSIQQAKIATTLDSLDTSNWDTLTTVYQALIGTADGAPQWTIASYVEQIKTDPSNPQARFNMGSLYRQIGNDDQALKLFEQAAQLKPDYANAYFNMADIYKKKGDKQNEYAMLQATLSFIKPDQNGYDSVKSRSDELQSQLAADSTKKTAPPTPAPTPKPTPVASSSADVNLPSDAGLPQTGTVPEVPKQ